MEDAPVVEMEDAPVVEMEDAPVVEMEDAPVVEMEDAPVVEMEEIWRSWSVGTSTGLPLDPMVGLRILRDS